MGKGKRERGKVKGAPAEGGVLRRARRNETYRTDRTGEEDIAARARGGHLGGVLTTVIDRRYKVHRRSECDGYLRDLGLGEDALAGGHGGEKAALG